MFRGLFRTTVVVFTGVLSLVATAQEMVRPPDPAMPAPEMPAFAKSALKSLDFTPAATTNASWPGMFQTTTIRPPDPHGCAGSNGILAVVNLRMQYYNKLGATAWGPVNFSTFFAPVGNTGVGIADPKALYDHNANRFYVILQENAAGVSFLNVAVSKSPNPASSTTADWFLYRINMMQTVGGTNYGGDYPGLGFDGQAIYVTYNMYPLPFSPSGGPKNCQIIILNKADALAGTSTFYRLNTPDGTANAFTLQPATVMSASTPGNVAYFASLNFANNTSVKLWSVSDPIGTGVGARTLNQSTVTVPNHGGFISGATQPSPGAAVPTLSPRTQGNAFYYNGSVWFAHTAGGSSGRAIVYYYRVDANGFPTLAPTLNESGSLDGGAGVSQFQPGIGGNRNGDVCIVFTRSSATINPTMMATIRLAGAATFDAPVTIKVSPTYSNSSRWGDYASVTPDPVNQTFWVTHEWARSATAEDWGTWWANVSSVAVPNSPPIIITQPASLIRTEGQSATFNVNVTGTGPLFYQWRKNGVNIAGANGSAYSIPSLVLADAGNFSVFVTNLFGTATSLNAVLTVNPAIDSVVYMRSIVGSPWNSTGNETALNTAFGAGNWQDLTFEEATLGAVFNSNIKLVFMDGSDDGAQEMETFLTANRVLIQNWVAAGGSLVLNCAPNEGDGMYFGFGVGLNYQDFMPTGVVVAASHPIFNGPFLPVGTTFTGSSFAHASVSGTDLLPLIVNPANGRIALAERTWGLGRVLFGGMTTPNFHAPSPNVANLRANMLVYAGTSPYKPYAYLRSLIAGEPWNRADNTNAMNRVFGATNWSNLQYETVLPGSLFVPATKFVFMEGSDGNAIELEAFLTANLPAISNWVSLGGSLLLNAAPNEGDGMNFGFGISNNYASGGVFNTATGIVAVGQSAHPIFNGPYLPVGATWSGNSFAHATVSGAGLTPLIVNATNSSRVLLGSKTFGSGCLLFGGMTQPAFHSPSIEATNLRANMIAFGRTWATNFPPVINYQPLSQSALIGQTVTFNVNASGTPPLAYQWRKNGINIGGATTATYTLPAVTAASAGTYSVLVSNPYGSILSSNAVLTITLPATGSVVYLRSTVGAPWDQTSNETNLNTAFGVGNWLDLRYETVNVASLLSPTRKFIYMEGSDDNALEMGLFLSNNIVAIQNWVSGGGSLFINAAPNEGVNQSLGFGVTLNYPGLSSSSGLTADPLHPIFNGPFLPVGGSWTGGSFAHATISGSGLTELITNSSGGILLAGKPWGAGYALFGGMTLTFFHNPDPQADNLRANILSYAGAQAAEAMPPMIVTQPLNRTAGYLQPVSFSVSAVGTLPLTYQWRKNGSSISSGTNATLTTLAINSGDEFSVVVANAFGSVISANGILTVTNVFLGNTVYLRSTNGIPWGQPDNETAMNRVFGAGGWLDQRYENVNVATLLSATTRFIFMEGSDSIASELETFLNANSAAIQNWVSAGGLLFINSAPNVGDGMNLGFGVTLNYGAGSTSANAGAVRLANPIFQGPFLPVGTAWTGVGFSHAYVTGGGVSSLITNSSGRIVLGEKSWGLGRVLFGGMTMPFFHDPDPQSVNLRANILAYLSTSRARAAYVRSTVGAPWGVNRNETAMDRAFGAGNWQDLRYETLNVASLLSTNTKFIYFEGGDFTANEMENFMTNYVAAVESWVAEGGHAFVNSAPNEGDGLNFGFGVLLTNRTTFLPDATAATPTHPVFNGPFLPVGTAWTGTSFAHGYLAGPDLTAVITNAAGGNVILAEKQIGQGHILFGSMTTDNFHDPDPQAENLRANILSYGASSLNSYCYAGFGTIYLTNFVGPGNVAPAVPYPSAINIAGVPGVISKVSVTLSNITHTRPSELDILLVAPSGERVMLLSDITVDASGFGVTDVTVTLDDSALLPLPTGSALTEGTYRPADYNPTDVLPAPAPVRPYGTTLSRFNGQSPNGTWSLYAADDFASSDIGTIRGWKLQIITTTTRPFLLIPVVVGPNVVITFRASSGDYTAADIPRFHIEASTDLITWTPISVTLSLNAGRLQFTQPGSSPYRFYRVSEP